ncbi:MAG: hypothetical protein HXY43_21360 [Fischerella sp.]|uniref:hypothetical protein n=1 Tax=Fischerella sp. TaxID=1191 RepID=UPI00182E1FB9|nr:hypothetical protein [Fischerella sp.]NWF61731.1 hypothetical protein [Fischerella sp.]
MNATQKFSAKAHTRPNYNYSNFHKSLLHENNAEDYALRHLYSLENTKELLRQWGWLEEDIKKGIDLITIEVYETFVYLHIPNKIVREYKTPVPHTTIKKIKGLSRFVSKADFVDVLINRCWDKADPYKLQIGDNWHELIAKGMTDEFYELNLLPHSITCSCHAYSGIEKAFLQDKVAKKYLIVHPVVVGQIPDKHVFGAWKYLGANTQIQYEHCWANRRDAAIAEVIGRRSLYEMVSEEFLEDIPEDW